MQQVGNRRPQVAVIGAGISGLGAAYRLAQTCDVSVFEAATVAGGHAHTVDVRLGPHCHPVDVGFLVYNHRTYPRLMALFRELRVATVPSNMTFSVSIGPQDFEWCGNDLGALFAQPSNALRPRFWRMLADMLRFNREATALARASTSSENTQTLGDFLRQGRYSEALRDDYLLPMAGAIWSCPVEMMLAFPVVRFARFCDNHGLLQIHDRPQWFTVANGSRKYVDAIVQHLRESGATIQLGCPVNRIDRTATGVEVHAAGQAQCFDAVVLASHAGQALAMLSQPLANARRLLGDLRTQANRAVLHTDTRLMPKRRRAWAAWNYLATRGNGSRSVAVTYWLQRLQPLPFEQPLFLTLNPIAEPDRATVIQEFSFAHPIFDHAAIAAQQRLASIQGEDGIWFAGAWAGDGFHEDGLRAGEMAAQAILAQFSKADAPARLAA